MSDSLKVITLAINVHDDIYTMLDQSFFSTPFTLKVNNSSEESTWKLECIFKDLDRIGIYFLRESGESDFEVVCTITLVCHENSTCQERYTRKLENKCGVISRFGCNINVDEDLFSNREKFFPNGNIQFTIKIITRIDDDSDDDDDDYNSDDSDEKPTNVSDVNTNLYKTMKYSDLIITSSDGVDLKAHKAILCTKSVVFDAMFTAGMSESLSGVIKCTDIDAKVLTELIRFIYCNSVDGLKNVDIELYEVAKRYQIEKLEQICLESIYERLNEKNALEIAIFSELHELKVLRSCCDLLIHANYSKVSTSDPWKSLDLKTKLIISDRIIQKISSTATSDDYTK